MSYTWPDENGNPVTLSELMDERLLSDTQRMVDAHRRMLDDCMRQVASSNTSYNVCDGHTHKPIVFTGRLKAMVDECTKRGLNLNTDR